MRKRIFDIIEVDKDGDKISAFYDWFMMITILISIIPLWFHVDYKAFKIIDIVTVTIFIIDYFLRWFTSDFRLNYGKWSFAVYPVTPWAIIDLLSIIPSIGILQKGFKLFKLLRLFRTFKVFRIFKAFRYSKSINIIINIFKTQKDSLLVVCGFSVSYILISALVMFNAEPETFNTVFDAIYWATISLTTVGYGDVYAVSRVGKIITMVSSVLGVAIVALPAGIIIAGYQEEVKKLKKKNE
jgi:voltage-gated potassium channel